ncbi:GTP-binding protein, rho subfamily [Serendipita vermifera]|nr:GTP-binding protein, rho subfamily [Serendipita vermifera]
MSKSKPEPPRKRIVVVGDGAVGKTSLLHNFRKNNFDTEFQPSVLEEFIIDHDVDGRYVELSLCDTGGQEDYDHLRVLAYRNADMVLICYTPEWRDSLENVEYKWVPEVYHYCPGVPFMLVGCKSDVRQDLKLLEMLKRDGEKGFTVQEAFEMAKKVSASAHMECSAAFSFGVREVFDAAVRILFSTAHSSQRTRLKECLIM